MCRIRTRCARPARPIGVAVEQRFGGVVHSKGEAMDRRLLIRIFETVDARFAPCGAAAFAERLGEELAAGRIVFPPPLTIGGGLPFGCVVVDRCSADPSVVVRTLARALADLVDPPVAHIGIGVAGSTRTEVLSLVERAARRELAGRGGIGLLVAPVASRSGWDCGPW